MGGVEQCHWMAAMLHAVLQRVSLVIVIVRLRLMLVMVRCGSRASPVVPPHQ